MNKGACIWGLMETEVKLVNISKVHDTLYKGWGCVSNITEPPRGRVWILWNRDTVSVIVLHIATKLRFRA